MDNPKVGWNLDDTIDAAEVAKLLHVEDKETVERMARNGELPAAKIGRSWVFMRSQVLDWLARVCMKNVRPTFTGQVVRKGGELTHPIGFSRD